MEQFSLEKWLQDKSRKVVTRDGRPVRIICWDRNTTYWKIIALVTSPDGSTENPYTYDVNGNESDGCLHDHRNDLFFADEEEELTEFEKTMIQFSHEIDGLIKYGNDNSVNRCTHRYSKQLLDLARKELEKEDWRKPLRTYKNGYEQGKQDALKNFLEWKKATEHKEFVVHVCVMDEDMCPYLDTEVNKGEYYIELDDLKALPKEE